MRAHAAYQFKVTHFGVWHLALAALVAAAVTSLGAWAWARHVQGTFTVLVGMALLGLPALMALVRPLFTFGPTQLRCDAGSWQLGPLGAPPRPAQQGEIHVALDLGAWMLLRFRAEPPAIALHGGWLPVQRRGMETEWHALRCAVYAPSSGGATGRTPPHA